MKYTVTICSTDIEVESSLPELAAMKAVEQYDGNYLGKLIKVSSEDFQRYFNVEELLNYMEDEQ